MSIQQENLLALDHRTGVFFLALSSRCREVAISSWRFKEKNYTTKFQDSLCKIVKNKYDCVKVLLKTFHLNDNTTNSFPQTQKSEPPYNTPASTLEVIRLCLKVGLGHGNGGHRDALTRNWDLRMLDVGHGAQDMAT